MKKPNKRRKSRAKLGSLPKGAYRLPTGGYVTAGSVGAMPDGRRIRIQVVRRDQPDLERFARALVEIARAKIDADNEQRDRAA